MSTSALKLGRENVLDVAKNAIKPDGWICEWNVAALQKPVLCRIVLNSWAAYHEHLLRHCLQSKGKGPSFHCRLPRCNIASGVPVTSYEALAHHIEHSHLNRGHLCCPVQGCSSLSFSRRAQLESHVFDSHPELIGTPISVPSHFLLPSWRPFRPPQVEPLPLPFHFTPPGTALLPPVAGTESRQSQDSEAPASQLSTLSSPRKRPRLQMHDIMEEDESQSRESMTFEFEDLPQLEFADDALQVLQSVYSIRSKGPPLDVARPQAILDREKYAHGPPKPSMLYDNFVRLNNLQDIRVAESPEPEPKPESASVPCVPIVGTSRDTSNAAN